MESKCEICGCGKTGDNSIFEIRIGEGSSERTARTFCEICLAFGAEMYESYMETRKKPESSCGRSKPIRPS